MSEVLLNDEGLISASLVLCISDQEKQEFLSRVQAVFCNEKEVAVSSKDCDNFNKEVEFLNALPDSEMKFFLSQYLFLKRKLVMMRDVSSHDQEKMKMCRENFLKLKDKVFSRYPHLKPLYYKTFFPQVESQQKGFWGRVKGLIDF